MAQEKKSFPTLQIHTPARSIAVYQVVVIFPVLIPANAWFVPSPVSGRFLILAAAGRFSPDSSPKLEATERQIKLLSQRYDRLVMLRDSRKNIKTMEKFKIQSLPEIIVASHREVIPNYDALGPLCYMKIGPAMQAAGCKCTSPGYCFTIDHNKEYKTENIDIEYCEQIEELLPDTPFLTFKKLPAIENVLCVKHIGPYDRFYETFTEAVSYLESKNMRIAGDPRFSYIDGAWNQEDPEKWVSVIQIPVE